MINLPTKDKNGKSFLTYSQIETFLKSKSDYTKQYILKEPFYQNKYLKLGLKVGDAIEKNDFSLFTKKESETLSKVERLDLFEKRCNLDYDSFYVSGRIDSCTNDLERIIDYKTGGIGKHEKYLNVNYIQIPIYALAIRQNEKTKVKSASVIFIERDFNLKISDKDPLNIPIDVSEERLKQVYNGIKTIAQEIEIFYENYLQTK